MERLLKRPLDEIISENNAQLGKRVKTHDSITQEEETIELDATQSDIDYDATQTEVDPHTLLTQDIGSDDEEEKKANDNENDYRPLSESTRYHLTKKVITLARSLTEDVSSTELRAFRRGKSLDGPPIHEHVKDKDIASTTLFWPMRSRNVLAKNFEQEASTITLNDAEDSDSDTEIPISSAAMTLPALARPLCEVVVERCQEHKMTSSASTRAHLSHIARDSNIFVDKLLESLLTRNAIALQGNEQNFVSTSWSMYQGIPSANWRFVADSVLPRVDTNGRRRSVLPGLLTEVTRQRIKARIQTLYAQSWQEELNAPKFSS
ncbi:hypothetical protein THRCLA_09244 [Thraustotheca clavata]|uniref:Uncharacterized protein n=1 Tax=Thraustotheca clavata TaxID=74557 RepID=A0A1V9YYP3_9STRA|nr:hypothetical protein THRCLA_09244 [Thraustotheca clavata]